MDRNDIVGLIGACAGEVAFREGGVDRNKFLDEIADPMGRRLLRGGVDRNHRHGAKTNALRVSPPARGMWIAIDRSIHIGVGLAVPVAVATWAGPVLPSRTRELSQAAAIDHR